MKMRPSEALAKHRDEVLEIIGRYPVSNPRVFGSVARGDDVEGSDLDILVDPQLGLTTFIDLDRLESELNSLLGAAVDVVTPGGLRRPVAERIRREVRPL
jgi:predicted nucleotidyltransferase